MKPVTEKVVAPKSPKSRKGKRVDKPIKSIALENSSESSSKYRFLINAI